MSTLSDLTGTWTLDPAHTELGFIARHAMVTKVRGSFTDFTGTAVIDGEHIEKSTVEVTIDTASIDTRNADRDAHLKTSDFFDMETYPKLTFTSTAVSATGSTINITGDLTIKGHTESVTIPFEFDGVAKDPYGNIRAGFEGAVTVNRTDFGLTFNAALETGGVLVSEKISLFFDISAIKQA